MHLLLDSAVAKRARLVTPETSAVRLIASGGDGLPGLILETYAGRWLVSTTSDRLAPEVREWIRDQGVSCYWKRLDQHQKESPAHFAGPEVTEPFLILENGVASEISFQSGYSQGIFLDQRDNRAEVRRLMAPGLRLLNTFAYTGAFSVAAAMAGAETTTLDLSQPYLDWAKRNFSHNALDPAAHHFCKGDTFHWLRRFAKQGRTFDGNAFAGPGGILDRATSNGSHDATLAGTGGSFSSDVPAALAGTGSRSLDLTAGGYALVDTFSSGAGDADFSTGAVGDKLYIFYDAPGGDSISHMRRSLGMATLQLPLNPTVPVPALKTDSRQ